MIGRQQQLVRIDFENEPGHEALAAKLADFEAKLPDCDVVVASVLLSMGMMMLPPMMIVLPFKLLLFVLVDGWYLLVGSLVKSFG